MRLLQDEEVLITSKYDNIELTNTRIMMTQTVWGKSYKIAIFLEDISSIEIHFRSKIYYLIIGLIILFLGLMSSLQGGGSIAVAGILIGGILIGIWWFSRKHLVTISSKGGSALNLDVEQVTDEKIEEFVKTVQEAKVKRVNLLYKV